MSNHFSLFVDVPPPADDSLEEGFKWSDLAKKALAKNSCAVNKRTVAKRFSQADYNNSLNNAVPLFVSSNPFLVSRTISFIVERNLQDVNVFTTPTWETTLLPTRPLNLTLGKAESKEYMLIGRRGDDSDEAVNDVIVICEILEFPKSSLNLFKDLL
jgi:hypothetical protein